MMTQDNPLISGILSEAEAKAEEIIRKAEEECASIIAEADERAERESQLEERSFSVRLERIKEREESARKNIDRLSELKVLDSAYNLVLKEVQKRLDSLVSSPDFRSILVSWIAEAAIGLDRKEARVSFSEKAPVDDQMLRDAEAEVLRRTGASVSLSEDPERLSEGGVSVSSLDGKVSYNNQLPVRIRRFQRDIKRIIQEENARQNSR